MRAVRSEESAMRRKSSRVSCESRRVPVKPRPTEERESADGPPPRSEERFGAAGTGAAGAAAVPGFSREAAYAASYRASKLRARPIQFPAP